MIKTLQNLTPFSRKNDKGERLLELRVNLPESTMKWLDAEAIHEAKLRDRKVSRTDIVARELNQLARLNLDKAMLLLKTNGDNPTPLVLLERRSKRA